MNELAEWMEGMSIGWSVNCTGPSFNLIKRNVPQSTITEANDGKIVTVTVAVFGNLYEEKNTAAVCGEASVLLSVLPEKQRLSPAKNAETLTHQVFVMKKKIPVTVSPPD